MLFFGNSSDKNALQKKIPMRMCVACREMRPKKELLRIVRTTDGTVEVDRTGKKNGRGAYLCAREECLNKALKIRALNRALDVTLDPETTARLVKEFMG